MMATSTEGRDCGAMRAERGIKRAAYHHDRQIRRDMLRMLDALLASPTGCATTDDAVDSLTTKHADGGRWRASVPKRLRADGLIVAERVTTSARPARHAGYLTEWRLIDRNAAEARRVVLAAEIKKDAGESGATDSPALDQTTHTSNGGNYDGQVI